MNRYAFSQMLYTVKSGNIAQPFMLHTLHSEPVWLYIWSSFVTPGDSVLLSMENMNSHVPSLQFG